MSGVAVASTVVLGGIGQSPSTILVVAVTSLAYGKVWVETIAQYTSVVTSGSQKPLS